MGFAYDLSGKGTTVIRGGASVIYSMFNPAQFSNSPNNFGGGNVAATPTGACTVAVAPCPSTFGGTIDLGTNTLSIDAGTGEGGGLGLGGGGGGIAPISFIAAAPITGNGTLELIRGTLNVNNDSVGANLSVGPGNDNGTAMAFITGSVDSGALKNLTVQQNGRVEVTATAATTLGMNVEIKSGGRFDFELHLSQSPIHGDFHPIFRYPGAAAQDLFHSGGVNIHAAHDDHVIHPSNDAALEHHFSTAAGATTSQLHQITGAIAQERGTGPT